MIPTTGAYVLLISISNPVTIGVGKLGKVDFLAGWYAYVGSAMGRTATSLHHRLRRHFAPESQKRIHWHIDHLLASPQCKVALALMIPSLQKLECQIVSLIESMGGQPWGSRFGSSDCNRCTSHLLFLYPPDTNVADDQILSRIQKEIEKREFDAKVVLKE